VLCPPAFPNLASGVLSRDFAGRLNEDHLLATAVRMAISTSAKTRLLEMRLLQLLPDCRWDTFDDTDHDDHRSAVANSFWLISSPTMKAGSC
jgi:hypothetical protein